MALFLVSCASADDQPRESVLVSAAASLTDAFTEVEAVFERANPGVDVILNLGGSSTLREQILEGAPVDVFASADRANMNRVVGEGEAADEPMTFARNRLEIAVPAGNPGGVDALEDLADENLLIGICARGVPCGDAARETLDRAGVSAAIDSEEPDVRALLTKIEAGELDAGITYVTDVLAREGDVEGVAIPEAVNVVLDYPIVVLTSAPNPQGARQFIDFVMSADGQAILADHGFSSP